MLLIINVFYVKQDWMKYWIQEHIIILKSSSLLNMLRLMEYEYNIYVLL